MNEIIWSYFHFLGLTHHDLFTLEKLGKNPERFLENIGKNDVSFVRKEIQPSVRKEAQKNPFSEYQTAFPKDCRIVHHDSADFPDPLRHIGHVPFLLYTKGILRTDLPLLAIVGSRAVTSYGSSVVKGFVPDLVRAGFGIVSGGAIGIDALAHAATLAAKGYTVSVLGTGIDRTYPIQNTGLFGDIVAGGGCLVSIFPVGAEAFPHNFPIRNEIVS